MTRYTASLLVTAALATGFILGVLTGLSVAADDVSGLAPHYHATPRTPEPQPEPEPELRPLPSMALRERAHELTLQHEANLAAAEEREESLRRSAAPRTYNPAVGGDWPSIAACIRQYESRGNYRAVSPSGKYRGAYQADNHFWEAYGGDPAFTGRHEQAPPEMQDAVAYRGWQARGLQPWPTPARRCR